MDTNIKETDTRFAENAASEAAREERRRMDEAARQAERSREITTRDLLDYMMGLMAQTDVVDRVIEAVKTMPLNETLNGGQGDEARGNALKALADGYSQNLRYALAIVERMYKGIHPEAYDGPGPFRNFAQTREKSGMDTSSIRDIINEALTKAQMEIRRS